MKNSYTYDYVHGTDVYLHQHKEMFRINTDTSLLAAFMKIRKGERVLDIGTNNAALLMVAAKAAPAHLYGIELQEEACILARHNLESITIPSTILQGDVREMRMPVCDVVVCNPPYFKVQDTGNLNLSKAMQIARHEKYLEFDELCQKMSEALQEKGRCYVVHRADRSAELLVKLQNHRLQVRTLQFVYDPNKEEAISVLIEAIKDGGEQTHVLTPIQLER